jgi:hypothetical protein
MDQALRARWPRSHRVGKSGQEATWPSHKLRLQKNIRPKTLLATGFSKWPGGHFTVLNAGQLLSTLAKSCQPRPRMGMWLKSFEGCLHAWAFWPTPPARVRVGGEGGGVVVTC